MKSYELLLAVSEQESENEQKDLIEQVKETIEKAKGSVKQIDSWGKRELAFPINKNINAFYWLITLSGDSKLPRIITDTLRIEDSILRFIIAETAKPMKVKTKTIRQPTKKLDSLVVR